MSVLSLSVYSNRCGYPNKNMMMLGRLLCIKTVHNLNRVIKAYIMHKKLIM